MAGTTYDAIVVGARCAGASTAMLLARWGYRVLLVDRSAFPSDIHKGHLIHRGGPRRLRDWGLLDRIAATTPALTTLTSHFGDFPLVSRDLVEDGLAWAYAPRREVLDGVLVAAAVEAGVEFRGKFAVEDLVFDGGRVAGVAGHGVSETARIVIGADGRNSRVARLVRAETYGEVPPLLCYYFTYWSGVASEGLEIFHMNRRLGFAFPTNGGRFAAFLAWPIDEFPAVRRDIERHYLEAADGFPGLGERLRAGRREEPFYGTADLPNFFRKPFGDGWALVGDAGYHKDPYMALGIADAFRDAELLAAAVDAGLSGREPLPAALAGYQAARDAASRADYDENLALARLRPFTPDVIGLRAALRGNPEQATRFAKARMALIPPADFFNPENLGRIMGGAAAAR